MHAKFLCLEAVSMSFCGDWLGNIVSSKARLVLGCAKMCAVPGRWSLAIHMQTVTAINFIVVMFNI